MKTFHRPNLAGNGKWVPRKKDYFQLSTNVFIRIPIDPKWHRKEIASLEGPSLNSGKYKLIYLGEKTALVFERTDGFMVSADIQGCGFFRSLDSVGRTGIDLRTAMDKPLSKSNILMLSGDSSFLPERLNPVKVIGEVGLVISPGGFFDRKPDAGSIMYMISGPVPKQCGLVRGINTFLATFGAILALVISIKSASK